jgi:hypothetical protein
VRTVCGTTVKTVVKDVRKAIDLYTQPSVQFILIVVSSVNLQGSLIAVHMSSHTLPGVHLG